MLLSFSISNFRSFRDRQTLSLQAETKHKQPFPGLAENLLRTANDRQLLPVKVMYGANGSGKSNLIQGLAVFHRLLTTQSLTIDFDLIQPFLRTDYHADEATTFEVELAIEGGVYRYGIALTQQQLEREWLYITSDETGRTAVAFERTGTTAEFGAKLAKAWSPVPGLLKKGGAALLRTDTLLLLQAANLGVLPAKTLINAVNTISLLTSEAIPGPLREGLMEKFRSPSVLAEIRDFLRSVGVSIESLIYLDRDSVVNLGFSTDQEQEILTKITAPTILVTHASVNREGEAAKPIAWPLENNESEGTKKLFWLATFLLNALKNGELLIIDEFEANLHPHLSEAIIDLFQYRQTNPDGGQLIIATHDTNLLQPSLLRRDQIAFVEKDEQGASEIYDLSDIDGVRGDSPYEKHYNSGKYGSVPQLDYPLIKPQAVQ